MKTRDKMVAGVQARGDTGGEQTRGSREDMSRREVSLVLGKR